MPAADTASTALDSPTHTNVWVGLKAQHYQYIIDNQPTVGWFEVHPENYMGAGGPPHRYLSAIRQDYPLSFHGVGLSLGSAGVPSLDHLKRLRDLIAKYEPFVVSEHVSWSLVGDVFLNDLLPVPYTKESLARLAANIGHTQDYLGRQILVENPSTYLQYAHAEFDEPTFLAELAARTGCGLLLDINNVYVSACNHGFDPWHYLCSVPSKDVGEIHLAGHAVDNSESQTIRIDDHGSRVCDDVWALYAQYAARFGSAAPLIEWDRNIPEFPVLQAEADRAALISTKRQTSEAGYAHTS